MNYERFELANGLRVLLAPVGGVHSVSVALMIGTGSRSELETEAGIAHLIEHLLFKGTAKRPSPWAVSETIERVGGVINAATDKEATVYWTKTASEHLALSIDLLADMVQNSKLSPGEISKEKAVIVEEIGMTMDEPQGWVHALVDEAIWPGHPLGREVAGTRQSVPQLSRAGIRDFMSTFYGPTNAVLVVAGAAERTEVQLLADQYFGAWSPVDTRPFLSAP